MKKVVLKWGRLSVLMKLSRASNVVSKMTENAVTFPNPDPPLSQISAAISALAASESAAEKGGTDRTRARDQDLEALQGLMNREVLYVQTIALGDGDIAALAGMEVEDDPHEWPVPEKPQNLRGKPGKYAGSVYLIVNSVEYKKLYVFQMWVEDDAGNGEWRDIKSGTRRTYTHMNLERGKLYRFRVYASNSKGDSPVSDEVVVPAG